MSDVNAARRRSISLSDADQLLKVELRTTASTQHQDSSGSCEPEVRLPRPSSIMVNDNEELVKLAQELQRRDTAKTGTFKSDCQLSAPTTLVRRNSSGYSTGSCSGSEQQLPHPIKEGGFKRKKSNTKIPVVNPGESVYRKSSCAGSDYLRRQSLAVSPGHVEPGRSKLNIGSFFGSKRNSLSSGGAQMKIAKKYERSMSTLGPIRTEDTIPMGSPRKERKVSCGEQKRMQFLQSRTSTGFNLFGSNRRVSIAVPDNAYSSAIRNAKSHIDLTVGTDSPPVTKRLGPGPGLSELQEGVPFGHGNKTDSLSRLKSSFRERSWADLERLWKSKSKETPNVEDLFKPRSSFRTRDKLERPKTIPPSPGRPSRTMSMSMTSDVLSNSPAMAKKATELMAPHVISQWQQSQGLAPIIQDQGHRFTSPPSRLPMASGQQSEEHFKDLVRAW